MPLLISLLISLHLSVPLGLFFPLPFPELETLTFDYISDVYAIDTGVILWLARDDVTIDTGVFLWLARDDVTIDTGVFLWLARNDVTNMCDSVRNNNTFNVIYAALTIN